MEGTETFCKASCRKSQGEKSHVESGVPHVLGRPAWAKSGRGEHDSMGGSHLVKKT